GVEFPLDEVIVLQGDAFEFERNVQLRIFAGSLKYLISGPLDDSGAGIVILVNPVAESHEFPMASFNVGNVGWNAILRSDFRQHLKDFFVGATMERAGERGGRRRGTKERIRLGAANGAHDVGAAVLFVVGMQNEQDVQG